MSQCVHLVGTSHVYQWRGREASPRAINAFSDMLLQAIRQHGVRLLAEEMNLEALQLHGQIESTPKCVAAEAGIQHACCDPTTEEKLSLGIVEDGAIAVKGWQLGWSSAEVEQATWQEYAKREIFWLQRLLDLDKWPVLFVCGSLHISSYSKKLALANKSVNVLHENWEA